MKDAKRYKTTGEILHNHLRVKCKQKEHVGYIDDRHKDGQFTSYIFETMDGVLFDAYGRILVVKD